MASGATLTVDLPAVTDSVPRARHAVLAFVETCSLPEKLLNQVALAVTEAVSNTVRHAYAGRHPGSIFLRASLDSATLEVTVRDEGTGIQPKPKSDGMGMGIPLMARLADDLQIVSGAENGGTRVTMRFGLGPKRRQSL